MQSEIFCVFCQSSGADVGYPVSLAPGIKGTCRCTKKHLSCLTCVRDFLGLNNNQPGENKACPYCRERLVLPPVESRTAPLCYVKEDKLAKELDALGDMTCSRCNSWKGKRIGELNAHNLVCPKVFSMCNCCREIQTRDHDCRMKQVACPMCRLLVFQTDLEFHKKNVCGLRFLNCDICQNRYRAMHKHNCLFAKCHVCDTVNLRSNQHVCSRDRLIQLLTAARSDNVRLIGQCKNAESMCVELERRCRDAESRVIRRVILSDSEFESDFESDSD